MTIQEIQKLKEVGFTVEQIEELDLKLKKRVGFRALVHMMRTLQDYQTPFSEVVEAWRLAAIIGMPVSSPA
jgi:phosphopantetheine adenylyltransferase